MSQFFVIKRADENSNSCPYWKSESTWCGSVMAAWQFECPFEAEFERKRRQCDSETWVAQITLQESRVELSAKPVPTRRGGGGVIA